MCKCQCEDSRHYDESFEWNGDAPQGCQKLAEVRLTPSYIVCTECADNDCMGINHQQPKGVTQCHSWVLE